MNDNKTSIDHIRRECLEQHLDVFQHPLYYAKSSLPTAAEDSTVAHHTIPADRPFFIDLGTQKLTSELAKAYLADIRNYYRRNK